MKKAYLIPLVSVLAGAGGFALRRFHLQTAFEPLTGLPVPGTAASYALLALSLGLAALLLLLAGRKTSPRPFANAFRLPGLLHFLLATLGALLIGAGAGIAFSHWRMWGGGWLELAFLLSAAFAAICMQCIAMANYRRPEWVRQGTLLLLPPAFCCCLWLMTSYQNWARDPFVSDYIFALFAIMSAMLFHYYMAAYAFGQPRETLTLLLGGLTVYFSMICLADPIGLSTACFFLGSICYTLPHLFALGRNRTIPFEPPAEPLDPIAPETVLPKEDAPNA